MPCTPMGLINAWAYTAKEPTTQSLNVSSAVHAAWDSLMHGRTRRMGLINAWAYTAKEPTTQSLNG